MDPSQKYHSLHSVYKLEIVAFLCELAVQTKKIKDDMDDSTNELTEVRKDLQEVRRQRKKMCVNSTLDLGRLSPAELIFSCPFRSAEEKLALEGPADPTDASKAQSTPLKNGHGDDDEEDGEEDASERASERPEDDPVKSEFDDDDDELSDLSDDAAADASVNGDHPPSSSVGPGTPASASGSISTTTTRAPSSRRETLLHQQLSKEADSKLRASLAAAAKTSAAHSRTLSSTLSRLSTQDAALAKEEDRLDREFRKQIHYPRSKPLGVDRFCNKVWWLDGFGSSGLVKGEGAGRQVIWGTGRIFVQGGKEEERRRWAERVGVGMEEVEERREREEGKEGRLGEGEWAVYEDPEEVRFFSSCFGSSFGFGERGRSRRQEN